MSLHRDEQGNVSMARALLALWTIWLMILLTLAWACRRPIDSATLALLSGVEMALITWAAGPRMAQYLAPAVARVAGAVGSAKRLAAEWRPEPDLWRDDERGDHHDREAV